MVGVGGLVGPLFHPVLYRRHKTPEAVPINISERTSYHGI